MLENGLSSGLIAYSNTADASAITAHKGHWITIQPKYTAVSILNIILGKQNTAELWANTDANHTCSNLF